MIRVLCLSGPNLQLLGTREPAIYGAETLAQIHRRLGALGKELGAKVTARQSNHEGELLDWIGDARGKFDGLLVNGAALTHTSLALYDAIASVALPTVEVHLSNPEAREPFRRTSLLAPACIGKVAGFRGESYLLALRALVGWLERSRT